MYFDAENNEEQNQGKVFWGIKGLSKIADFFLVFDKEFRKE
jgi:hypothetical protein